MNTQPPHDADAEQVLLGNCIWSETAAPLRGFDLSLFYSSNNRLIAAEMLAMADAGEPVTLTRLAQRLDGEVQVSYISALTDGIPFSRDLSFYLRRIKETATYRRGAMAAYALQQAYLSGDPDLIGEALQNLEAARQGSDLDTLGVRTVSLSEFLAMELPPRGMLLDPIIPEQGLVMIYSKRGVGKTHIALGMAVAVASGTAFLRWTAPSPQPVLYVDGELPASLLQKWIAEIVMSLEADAPDEQLRIITPDLQECGIPDLSTPEGQRTIAPHVKEARLIILDNLSALCRTGAENEAEGWLPIQEWVLNLRRAGKSVVILHHAGHQGRNQQGTSKREDLLDTVIALRHPADYNPANGLLAEVHVEKARHFHGDHAKSFVVELAAGDHGGARWATRNLDETRFEKASRLFSEDGTVEDVIEELGVSRATAFRFQKRFRQSQVSPPTGVRL